MGMNGGGCNKNGTSKQKENAGGMRVLYHEKGR